MRAGGQSPQAGNHRTDDPSQLLPARVLRNRTDYAGRREFGSLPADVYHIQVEKEGFYTLALEDFRVGEIRNLSITLKHQQELPEVVNVYETPPASDPAKTAASETLEGQEIVNLPYPTPRDVRNSLPFISGVLRDAPSCSARSASVVLTLRTSS